MRLPGRLRGLLAREWLPILAAALLVVLCTALRRVPRWSRDEVEVLVLLAALLVTVRGLALAGAVRWLARRLEAGRQVPLRLVVATWLLSMVVTNDVALLAIVPLTLALDRRGKGFLVVLETLAANAGSALTPVGNPQNLFLYWRYHPDPAAFVATIAPLALSFLALVAGLALLVPGSAETEPRRAPGPPRRAAAGWALLLAVLVLVVVRALPFPAVALVALAAPFLDRRALAIDLGLLVAFACFFGIADVLRTALAPHLAGGAHVLVASALASQLLGNVPATLLFSEFTADWRALLWGVSVGGFGTLVASLANLIAWRLYVTHPSTADARRFTLLMHAAGAAAFLLGLALAAAWGPAGILGGS